MTSRNRETRNEARISVALADMKHDKEAKDGKWKKYQSEIQFRKKCTNKKKKSGRESQK